MDFSCRHKGQQIWLQLCLGTQEEEHALCGTFSLLKPFLQWKHGRWQKLLTHSFKLLIQDSVDPLTHLQHIKLVQKSNSLKLMMCPKQWWLLPDLVSCAWLAAHELQGAAQHASGVSCPVRLVIAASLYFWWIATIGDKQNCYVADVGAGWICCSCHANFSACYS